jgi:hypothetical protein
MRRNVGIAEQSANAATESAIAAKSGADAATATLKLMKRTAHRELRARVFVEGATLVGKPAPGGFAIEFTIRNFGKVPAYGCTHSAALVLRNEPCGESELPVAVKTGQEPIVVLPPGGEIKVLKSLPAGIFENAQHTRVMQGAMALYVYGEIRYIDGFQIKRHSTFRMKCCGADYGLGRFSFCERGNKAN